MLKKQHYFMHGGRKVMPGEIIKLKSCNGTEEFIFQWYIPEKDLFVLRHSEKPGVYPRRMVSMKSDEFKQRLMGLTNKMNEYIARDHQVRMKNNKLSFAEELSIDGMATAWLWYVVLMAITFIFVGRIFYWAFLSLCFFIYRYGTLSKAGYKDKF